jgi:hypothetical protein
VPFVLIERHALSLPGGKLSEWYTPHGRTDSRNAEEKSVATPLLSFPNSVIVPTVVEGPKWRACPEDGAPALASLHNELRQWYPLIVCGSKENENMKTMTGPPAQCNSY